MKYFMQQIWERHNLALEPERSKVRLVFAEIAGELERVAQRQRERLEGLSPPTDSSGNSSVSHEDAKASQQ